MDSQLLSIGKLGSFIKPVMASHTSWVFLNKFNFFPSHFSLSVMFLRCPTITPPFFSVSVYVVWSTKLNLYLRCVDLQVYHSVQHGDSLFVVVDVVCLFVLVLPLMSALSPPPTSSRILCIQLTFLFLASRQESQEFTDLRLILV